MWRVSPSLTVSLAAEHRHQLAPFARVEAAGLLLDLFTGEHAADVVDSQLVFGRDETAGDGVPIVPVPINPMRIRTWDLISGRIVRPFDLSWRPAGTYWRLVRLRLFATPAL